MLFSGTCKHLHRGMSQPLSSTFFSLFSLPQTGLCSIASSNPRYTGSACCSILAPVVCYSYLSAFLLLQRNCEQWERIVRAHACCREVGEESKKSQIQKTWRAKNWLIRKLREIITGPLAIPTACVPLRVVNVIWQPWQHEYQKGTKVRFWLAGPSNTSESQTELRRWNIRRVLLCGACSDTKRLQKR